MANNVTTIIEDPSIKVRKALLKNNEVDFNLIVPRPKILDKTSANLNELNSENNIKAKELTGYNNWHDWSLECWGTGWNAYGTVVCEDKIAFQTAWAMPEPILAKLSEITGEVIVGKYADEDLGSNCGTFRAKDGDITLAYPEGDAEEFADLVCAW